MKPDAIKFESSVLAIMPEKLNDIIAARQEAVIEDAIDIEAAINRRATKFKDVKGKVVTVPLYGYISHKASIWSALGFETSSETFAGWLEDLAANADVGAIVIDVDSPGGTAAGLSGVTDKIYALRGKKPIIAVASDLMASAAYYLGSAADEVIADPDSLTGSIGTIGVHVDWSAALEKAGLKVTMIYAGKYKSEGNPYEPLTDEAKEDWQNMVNQYSETFIAAVARNRGITETRVREEFGQGRVFKAAKAKSVGMVDRIATLEQVVRDLLPKGKAKSRAQAQLDIMRIKH